MKSIKFLSSILLVLLINGCCVLRTSDLSLFPPLPDIKQNETDPVISYDTKTKTYVVSKNMVHNAVQQKIFIDNVLEWKKYNGVK